MIYYAQINIFWQGNEAEYHHSGSNVADLLVAISQQLRLDMPGGIDTLTIHIHSEEADGED